MTTISCVLKSGGDYRPEHVVRLGQQLDGRPLSVVGDTPLAKHKSVWPGWWSKIEALRIPGPHLQLDLDVTIVGDLGPLLEAAREHEFIACRDFWHPEAHGLNSSVMAWRGDMSWLAQEFVGDADRIMAEYTSKAKWGDQAFIRDQLKARGLQPAFWQDILPGAVLSYKRDVLLGADTSNTRIIVYHGHPKPWSVGLGER